MRSLSADCLARCILHGEGIGRRKHRNTTQEIMKTTVLLFKNNNETWSLASFKGDIIPTLTFKTATEAKTYALKNGWAVLRDKNCDA